jgi:hypothetical protein
MGCGWLDLDPDDQADRVVWQHEADQEREYSTCPGFTVFQIADVADISRAYLHWDKAQLSVRVGDEPAKALVDGIEVLHHSVSRYQRWVTTRPRDK